MRDACQGVNTPNGTHVGLRYARAVQMCRDEAWLFTNSRRISNRPFTLHTC